MTLLTMQDVEKIADLARLELSEAEKEMYLGQLTAVLEYADRLNELDLDGVPPTAHAISQQNVMRDDVIEPSLPTAAALQNSAWHTDDQFAIQTVL